MIRKEPIDNYYNSLDLINPSHIQRIYHNEYYRRISLYMIGLNEPYDYEFDTNVEATQFYNYLYSSVCETLGISDKQYIKQIEYITDLNRVLNVDSLKQIIMNPDYVKKYSKEKDLHSFQWRLMEAVEDKINSFDIKIREAKNLIRIIDEIENKKSKFRKLIDWIKRKLK